MHMNDSELERELRRLALRQPSSRLEDRIAHQLDPTDTGLRAALADSLRALLRRIFPPIAWASAGAAVTLALVAPAGRMPEPVTAGGAPAAVSPAARTSTSFEPVAATQVILGATDEGLDTDAGRTEPLRRLRVTSVERRTWTDASGAELQVEVPRQEIFLTSLAVQ
jgi:hypothetical protein